jgi:hypothetical protein
VKIPRRTGHQGLQLHVSSFLGELDPPLRLHCETYASRLDLSLDDLLITTKRHDFELWLGRKVSASIGGAYVYLAARKQHAILINVPRLNSLNPRAAELVIAEELVHMRDFIDGDRRRHAKHGCDRIALRVLELTGATLDEIRNCTIVPKRRPIKYHYACPACGWGVGRRRRGVWSCSRCSPEFDRRFELTLVRAFERSGEGGELALQNQDHR